MDILEKYLDGSTPIVGTILTLAEMSKEIYPNAEVEIYYHPWGIAYYPHNEGTNEYYHNIIVPIGGYDIVFNAVKLGIVDADYIPTVFVLVGNEFQVFPKSEIERIYTDFYQSLPCLQTITNYSLENCEKIAAQGKVIHELKTTQPYFDDVFMGRKTFDVRKNDRGFKVGDIIILKEWNGSEFTGKSLARNVRYVLSGGQFGIESGYVVMDIG